MDKVQSRIRHQGHEAHIAHKVGGTEGCYRAQLYAAPRCHEP